MTDFSIDILTVFGGLFFVERVEVWYGRWREETRAGLGQVLKVQRQSRFGSRSGGEALGGLSAAVGVGLMWLPVCCTSDCGESPEQQIAVAKLELLQKM